MNDLISITINEQQQPIVSGRELHEYLQVGTEYRHWFPRMAEYGFVDGSDYTPVIFDHPQNGQPTIDHAVTIDMAKELCMIQRTERGKQARQYFIQVEKDFNSPEKLMARALKVADDELRRVNATLAIVAPKAESFDRLMDSNDSISIGDLAKLLQTGQNRLFKFLRGAGVLMEDNIPYQRHIDAGRFRLIEQTWKDRSGNTHINIKTLVTPRGQGYIRQMWDKAHAETVKGVS